MCAVCVCVCVSDLRSSAYVAVNVAILLTKLKSYSGGHTTTDAGIILGRVFKETTPVGGETSGDLP